MPFDGRIVCDGLIRVLAMIGPTCGATSLTNWRVCAWPVAMPHRPFSQSLLVGWLLAPQLWGGDTSCAVRSRRQSGQIVSKW